MQSIASVVSFRSKYWFWAQVSSTTGIDGFIALLSLVDWTVSAGASVGLLGWHIAVSLLDRRSRSQYSEMSVNDDGDPEAVPLLREKSPQNVQQQTGSTFTGFGKKIKMLWPYVWPTDQLGLQLRILVCIGALIGIRITNVMVPLAFKDIVDQLSQTANSKGLAEMSSTDCPWNEITIYVMLRFCQGSCKSRSVVWCYRLMAHGRSRFLNGHGRWRDWVYGIAIKPEVLPVDPSAAVSCVGRLLFASLYYH